MTQSNAQCADEGDEEQRAGRRPKDTVRHGNVEIAIWESQGSGSTFYTASTPRIQY